MTVYCLDSLPERQVVPGFHARFVHSDHMTLAYWHVEAQAVLPEHSHPHEQVTSVLEGEIEITISGKSTLLKAGEVVVIPSNIPHKAKALSPCRLMDAFYPAREEYRK